MSVVPFPSAKKEKPQCLGHLFADDPAGGTCWAEIQDFGTHAVVRMMREAPLRRYVVDSVEEGFRLAYRIAGYPHTQVQKLPKSSHYNVAVGFKA